jgi:hypothetical protein
MTKNFYTELLKESTFHTKLQKLKSKYLFNAIFYCLTLHII